VLNTRLKYPNSTLADLYDPLTMPIRLNRAHQILDRAVDAAYGLNGFIKEALRVSFLFNCYQKLLKKDQDFLKF
jgi:hypothetical protein